MSWWVYLEDHDAEPWCSYPDDCPEPCYPNVSVEQFTDGGTYVFGGSSEAELNVTYNYGVRFREAWDGVGLEEMLDGKMAREVVEALERGVAKLGTQTSDDYWEPTEGNAGHTLQILATWARSHPEATFKVN